MEYGAPDGTTPIDGATKRIPHQYFSYTPPTDGAPVGTYGPSPANPTYNFAPQKFYELEMEECFIKVHPDYAPTRFFAFDGVVPGPLIKAKYGEPVLVRYKNKLPSVKVPQNFGIAEMTTHLHNGHTPSESDGNPVNYFNSINDPNAVNPHGLQGSALSERVRRLQGSAIRPGAATRTRLWARCGTTITTSISPPRTSTRACSAATTCSIRWTAVTAPACVCRTANYDMPIFFHDALFDRNCQTVFDLFNLDGILGDRFLANGAIQPHLERQEVPLSVPDLRPGSVALVGMVAVGRHQLPAVLADQHRRQPAAQRRAGDQRAYRRGRAGRHHRRLQQDQGDRASTSSTVPSR